MATKRPSFEKRERDRAKKARAAAKRQERLERGVDRPESDEDEAASPAGSADQSQVLARLEALHQRFEAEEIDFDTFEEERAALLAQLSVE